jgi:hypothetical protein
VVTEIAGGRIQSQQQFAVEAPLDRPDGDILAVTALEDVIERCARIDDVVAALRGPAPARDAAEEDRRQGSYPVDDCSIHNLSLAQAPGFVDRCQ